MCYRKTAAQIRRLRESIQAKAFKMNNPPAYYEKRKTVPKNVVPQKITEEERLDQENQVTFTFLFCFMSFGIFDEPQWSNEHLCQDVYRMLQCRTVLA